MFFLKNLSFSEFQRFYSKFLFFSLLAILILNLFIPFDFFVYLVWALPFLLPTFYYYLANNRDILHSEKVKIQNFSFRHFIYLSIIFVILRTVEYEHAFFLLAIGLYNFVIPKTSLKVQRLEKKLKTQGVKGYSVIEDSDQVRFKIKKMNLTLYLNQSNCLCYLYLADNHYILNDKDKVLLRKFHSSVLEWAKELAESDERKMKFLLNNRFQILETDIEIEEALNES